MNAVIGISGVVAILLVVGSGLGLLDRKQFSFRWLLVVAGLVVLNDLLLTNGYGIISNVIGGNWNWQGKLLALAGTLGVASLAPFGWKRVGLTFQQRSGSLRAALPVAFLYCGFFLVIALFFPSDPPTTEDVVFQLTMPGLEEEPFYRGILLFAFDRAFRGRFRFLGVDWGWGAVLSCVAFGLAHAFGYSNGALSFEPMIFALTAVPSVIAVWLRYRTGSLLLPVGLHNFGNAIGLLV